MCCYRLRVLLALSWPVGSYALLAFALMLAATRIVSLSSLTPSLTAIIFVYGLDHPSPHQFLVTVGGLYVVCLAGNVCFQNISRGEVTARRKGKQSFAEMAELGASAFGIRQQKVVNAITVAGTTLVEIDYSAVVATAPPNGWKAGQKLAFSGSSAFRVEDGKIVSIVDES